MNTKHLQAHYNSDTLLQLRLSCRVWLMCINRNVPETVRDSAYFNLKMTLNGDSFSLTDLERFTTDIACNKSYQIILSSHTKFTNTSIFLIVKSDGKVFVRDFFRDSRKERNITLLTVNFNSRTTQTFMKINKANNAGLEYVVEGRGVVSLFGRMSDRRARCQLYIGMLPTFHDSTRCKLCEAESAACGFCNWQIVEDGKSRSEQDISNTDDITLLHISAVAYTNDCLYWDEDKEQWTNKGCKVE